MRVVAIVPAAGSGKRLRAEDKKPFVLLGGKPLITYPLKILASSGYVDSIIIAAGKDSIGRIRAIVKRYGLKKVAAVVKGGETRAESVRNCFNAITGPCDIVLIHDAARPFIDLKAIKKSIRCAAKIGGCIIAVRATDTIKLADKNLFVRKTLDRSRLWRAQTPQAFRYGILKKALNHVKGNSGITDDASFLERLGRRVKILEGSARNIKITTPEDLKAAEVLL